MVYSANSDPKLTDWLRWASVSGEVSSFVQAIAEAVGALNVTSPASRRNLKSCADCQNSARFGSERPRWSIQEAHRTPCPCSF